MSEFAHDVPELLPGEVFVNKETYLSDMPGRVPSEDIVVGGVYAGRGRQDTEIEAYYAGELPVRVTELTRLNETDYRITIEPVLPKGAEEYYELVTVTLRDGMLLDVLRDPEIAPEDQINKEQGYLLDKDKMWDNAFRRMSASVSLSELAVAGAVQ